MDVYRTYREPTPDLQCFRLSIGETDLWIESSWDCRNVIEDEVKRVRIQLREYIHRYPEFAKTLKPWCHPPQEKPPVPFIQTMMDASSLAGVGPMAAVAGAIAGAVGERFYQPNQTLIIENGGDIFLASPTTRRVGIFAGRSSLSSRMALKISPDLGPLGICTSAGRVGPSLSLGKADAVVVLSPNTALADAAATAIANQINCSDDLPVALEWSRSIPGLSGVLAIQDNSMAAWGTIEIVPGNDRN